MRSLSLCVGVLLLLSSSAFGQSALESPAHEATLSGVGFISGWKCHADRITVTIDGGEHMAVAMRQRRGDVAGVCGGTADHGFIMQINWALLGPGVHEVVAYDAGVAFGRATFTVGSIGEEFLRGVVHEAVIDGFPGPGQRALLIWNESTQHFEVVEVFGEGVPGYDRGYWRQYDSDVIEGTYEQSDFLYAEEPDADTCQAGRLTQAAKNRALEAANHIRALHGLSPLRYSSRYDQQVQAASLVQAANNSLTHYPEPGSRCYTEAGAAGSGSSNLSFGGDGSRYSTDPAANMVRWTNDAGNIALFAAAGHRRWVLNPFSVYMSYGQVYGYATHKVFGFAGEPAVQPQIDVDFVAFPYEVYPAVLVEGNPPWSLSVIEDRGDIWGNEHAYFEQATITVVHASSGAVLTVTNQYADSLGSGVPNFLSWQVQGWKHGTLYRVTVDNVRMQSGGIRHFAYNVLVE